MKRCTKFCCLAFCVCAVLFVAGCAKKQTTTLQEPQVVQEPVKEVPEPVVDTSDEVTFTPVDDDAEIRKNLQTIYFDYNSYVLKQEERDKLAVAGSYLRQNTRVRVLIEGNCDERGSSEYNMGLGENRARTVKEYLVNYGISSSQIEITSWGKEHPVNFGCTDEPCHAQNRRAEYKVLSK